jgi:WD40 repeat protein
LTKLTSRSHGRDNKINVWAFSEEDEQSMSTTLPIEDSTSHRKQPWLLHSLTIPTLNFCSFACCPILPPTTPIAADQQYDDEQKTNTPTTPSPPASSLLIAVSGQNDSTIDLYQLPSEKKVGMIPAPEVVNGKSGMVMALKMFHSSTSARDLHVIAGYESGRTYVYKRAKQQWDPIYTSCPHNQPVLALGVSPGQDFFWTSSADAIIARHRLDDEADVDNLPKVVQTRHAGQQGLRLRSDGRVFATAGWDGRIRVYSAKSMKELAVLKWHKDGCYAVAFAAVDVEGVQDVSVSTSLVKTCNAVQQTVGQTRDARARNTHWLAAGAKDGKVSLWDIY